ncbi:hypothetical protein KJ762_13485 [bacterium]|nr:hypothetical protein [bacterium]MBU1065689.1 hypothetical protein [bacterium]MBU1635501.1 hypothetical protein [bacterium]MBU1873790.1 hypothetical protein [bacterium]
MADSRSTRLNRRPNRNADSRMEQKAPDIDFSETNKRSEYLKHKLDDILDNIGKSYGKRMADELMKRLEKTILDFNGEVIQLLDKLEVLEAQRLKELEAEKNPIPKVEAGEEALIEENAELEDEFANMSDFEKRIEMLERKKKEKDDATRKSEEESDEKPKKKGFFRKKNK